MKEENIEHYKSKFFDSFIKSNTKNLNEAFKQAASNGHFEIVNFIWNNCDDAKKQAMFAADDYLAFRYAASNGYFEMVSFLIENCIGGEIENMWKSEDFGAFKYIAFNDNIEILALITNQLNEYSINDTEFKKTWCLVTESVYKFSIENNKMPKGQTIEYIRNPQKLIELAKQQEKLIDAGWSWKEIIQIPEFIKLNLENILKYNSFIRNLSNDIKSEIIKYLPIKNNKGEEVKNNLTPLHLTTIYEVLLGEHNSKKNKKSDIVEPALKKPKIERDESVHNKTNIENELNFWQRLVEKTKSTQLQSK